MISWGCSTQQPRWHLGAHLAAPLFLEEHVLMLWLLILVSWLGFIVCHLQWRVWSPPLQVARVPLLVGGSIPHQRGRQALSFLLTWGYLPVSLPLVLFGLAYHDPVLWVVTFIVGFTICQHQWALMSFPLPYVCAPSEVCSHITLPQVFTHLLWMLW